MNDAAFLAPMPLAVQPLTPQAFAPYGTVLAAPAGKKGRPINGGNAERFDLVGDLQLGAQGGRPMLALFRAQARRFPHEVTEMERHALGSQTFVPWEKGASSSSWRRPARRPRPLRSLRS